jgi:hypothetical protein
MATKSRKSAKMTDADYANIKREIDDALIRYMP